MVWSFKNEYDSTLFDSDCSVCFKEWFGLLGNWKGSSEDSRNNGSRRARIEPLIRSSWCRSTPQWMCSSASAFCCIRLVADPVNRATGAYQSIDRRQCRRIAKRQIFTLAETARKSRTHGRRGKLINGIVLREAGVLKLT